MLVQRSAVLSCTTISTEASTCTPWGPACELGRGGPAHNCPTARPAGQTVFALACLSTASPGIFGDGLQCLFPGWCSLVLFCNNDWRNGAYRTARRLGCAVGRPPAGGPQVPQASRSRGVGHRRTLRRHGADLQLGADRMVVPIKRTVTPGEIFGRSDSSPTPREENERAALTGRLRRTSGFCGCWRPAHEQGCAAHAAVVARPRRGRRLCRPR